MKELNFLKIINDTLDDSSYLGNDCAYLKDLDVFVTQDTLVEDVHFTMHTISPYLLAKKSVAVNISDLAASLSKPEYITVSLSLPSYTEDSFVSEFYRGINDSSNEYGVKVIGGDITGADKITVSICAVGKRTVNYIPSRNSAKNGDLIYITGVHGSSSAGLYSLMNFLYADEELINSHLCPIARIKESEELAKITDGNITIIDSSDGLIDALYKIAVASKHSIEIDINKVKVSEKLIEFSAQNNLDYKKFVKWGGEDYELVFAVSESYAEKLDNNLFTKIGRVVNKDSAPIVIVKDNGKTETISDKLFESESFNHFGNNM